MPSNQVRHFLIQSKDRERVSDSSPSSYTVRLPETVRDVTQVQLSTLELPSNQTHMTVERDVNDRIWFSEGLKVDLGETDASGLLLKEDITGISGLDMRNNQLCIRESSSTNFVVGVPAYLCPITAVDGSTGTLTCADVSANYTCYLAWWLVNPTAPKLRVVSHNALYDEILDSSFAIRVPGDSALFVNSFVCCPPLSVQELASYLSYAFQNYSTYFGASNPKNTYYVEYRHGYVSILTSSLTTSASLHFPTTANGSNTAHYGTQYPEFASRTPLNGSGSTITSLGYMLGLASNARFKSWTDTVITGNTITYVGVVAGTAPRFIFEARLLAGLYTQQTLSAALPIALNPLYFPKSNALPGFGYFGFCDSHGVDKLVIVPPGKYTIETFCRALSYLLTRMDSRGLFYATSAYSYRDTPLDGNQGARPSITVTDSVVYNVSYDFGTSQFTIESGYASPAQPNDPSGNSISLSAKDGPSFGIYFNPTTLSKIATRVTDLASLVSSSQLDRLANVLGFEIQDHVGQNSYTSTNASHIPRIPSTLSQGASFTTARPKSLANNLPGELGISSAPYGAGPQAYMYPSGRYTATGNSPPTNGLNLISNSDTGHSVVPTFGKKAVVRTDGLKLTVSNDGQAQSDYATHTASSFYSTSTYVVGDATYTSPQRPGNVIFQVDSVVQTSGSAMSTVRLVDAGSGLSTAVGVSFNEIAAHNTYRKGVKSTSTTDPTCTFSSHAIHESVTKLAATMCEPMGFQVGDVVQVRCAQEALSVGASAPGTQMTVPFTGPGRSIPGSTTYSPSGGSLTASNYHVVLGGNYDAVVQVTEDPSAAQVLSVVEPGTQYYAGDTYYLSKPIRYETFSALVTQLPNAGGQFLDTSNSANEQFYTSLPNPASSTACVAGRYSDGSVVRARIPSSLLDNGFGHFQLMQFELPVRTDFHMEDSARETVLRQYSAHTLVGLGSSYVPIRANVEFPANMDVTPVPYVLIAVPNLRAHIQTQIMGDKNHAAKQDVLGKVILGAPVAISKTSPMSLYLDHASIHEIRIEFRLPDNSTLYNFHGLDHTLTLSVVSEPQTW
jgi:hypothetical protein